MDGDIGYLQGMVRGTRSRGAAEERLETTQELR